MSKHTLLLWLVFTFVLPSFSMKTIEEIKQIVYDRLAIQNGTNRFSHILGVEKLMISLANHYQMDVDQARLCAFVHDATKMDSWEEHERRIIRSFSKEELDKWPKAFWHCLSAVDFLTHDLSIQDDLVKDAILYHGSGKKAASRLTMMLYIADYAEENRPFPNAHIRELAMKSLEQAMAQTLVEICDHEQKLGHTLMQTTQDALLYYRPYLGGNE